MSTTYIGATLAIATGLPATIDDTGFAALTWAVADKGNVSIGAIGDTHETIPVPDLTTGRNTTLKGSVTGDTINIALSRQTIAATGQLTAAQIAFKAAAKAQSGDYSIRVTETNGVIHYIGGVPMNWKNTEMTTTSYAGFSFDFADNTGEVTVYPAPGP